MRKNDKMFIKIFELYQVVKCFNTSLLYKLKALLSKN